MLPSFCRDEVTVQRGVLTEKRGTQVIDWANPEEITLGGCSVQPTVATRDFDGRTIQVSEEWTLYAPPGSDLKAGDRVVWNNTTFEINGAPMAWKSPTGRISHMWARLAEWRG